MKKPKQIKITRPTLRPFSAYTPSFRAVLASERLTMGKVGKEFEEKLASYLGVKHCVVVSSCTSGLMLAMRGLGLTGEVILPSFTFAASGLPLVWNSLKPVFADCDPETFCIDPTSVERLITPNTSAIIATHVFGVPCDVARLQKMADTHKLRLVYDSAHAFGSVKDGVKVGNFGDVEVFSCSPTKVLTTGEGGIVATNNESLADFVRRGRNYGDDGASKKSFPGLSARMSEFNAALGLVSLKDLPKNLTSRRAMAEYFKKKMRACEPRLCFQHIPHGVETTYKDLSVLIDPALGYSRDELQEFFEKQNIETRKYFFPPLHKHATYAGAKSDSLSTTERVASQVLSLPLYSHITKKEVDAVVSTFKKFHDSHKA